MRPGWKSLPALLALPLAGIASTVAAAEHQVTANSDNTFTPALLTLVAGDSVTWTNTGGFHNVRADDDSFRCADGCDGAGGNGNPALPPWSFTLVFDSEAMIPYFCEVHGSPGGFGMSGTLIVRAAEIFADGFESGDTSAWSGVAP